MKARGDDGVGELSPLQEKPAHLERSIDRSRPRDRQCASATSVNARTAVKGHRRSGPKLALTTRQPPRLVHVAPEVLPSDEFSIKTPAPPIAFETPRHAATA